MGNSTTRRKYNKSPSRQKRERDRYLKKTYGITSEEYEAILAKQNGGCAVCGYVPKPGGRRLHIDHNHKTGKIRGILCWRCNNALGWVRDNPDILTKLAAYLQRGVELDKSDTESG